jgi:hypothetical protein
MAERASRRCAVTNVDRWEFANGNLPEMITMRKQAAAASIATGVAVTGIAAGAAYYMRRRRRTGGMDDEPFAASEPTAEINGPEHLNEPLGDMAHLPDNPQ